MRTRVANKLPVSLNNICTCFSPILRQKGIFIIARCLHGIPSPSPRKKEKVFKIHLYVARATIRLHCHFRDHFYPRLIVGAITVLVFLVNATKALQDVHNHISHVFLWFLHIRETVVITNHLDVLQKKHVQLAVILFENRDSWRDVPWAAALITTAIEEVCF